MRTVMTAALVFVSILTGSRVALAFGKGCSCSRERSRAGDHIQKGIDKAVDKNRGDKKR